MNKLKSLAATAGRKYSVKLLQAKKNSPAIMFGAGVIGVGVTVVLASRSSLKLEAVIDEGQANIDKANHLWEHGHEGEAFYANEAEFKKDVTLAYAKTGINIAKLYAPAFIVGSLAIGCLTGAHVTLQRRNGALVLAYAGLEKAYNEYQKRVKDEVGEDKARELKHGFTETEVYSEKKNGEPVVTRIKKALDGDNPYTMLFGPHSSVWNASPEYNIVFLRCQQNIANDMLQAKGYLLLNDVLESLGLEKTSTGAVVGWVYGNDLPGDNYVDFGCWSNERMDAFHDFMTGGTDSILLDFNVAGQVYQLIDTL